MKDSIIEAIEAVRELNESISNPKEALFSLETDGFVIIIEFSNKTLYYSEDSDLSYTEMNGQKAEYSILQYCKIKFEELKEQMSALTFKN